MRNRRAQDARRKVTRPPYDQLLRDIETLGYLGAGRKYGVSDNAIRKWRRAYEADAGGSGPPRPAPAGEPTPAHAMDGQSPGEEARMG